MAQVLMASRIVSSRRSPIRFISEARFCACGKKLSIYNLGATCYGCQVPVAVERRGRPRKTP